MGTIREDLGDPREPCQNGVVVMMDGGRAPPTHIEQTGGRVVLGMKISERIAELENPVCCPGMEPIGIDEPCVIAIRDRAERIAQYKRLLALVAAVEVAWSRHYSGDSTDGIDAALDALHANGDIESTA